MKEALKQVSSLVERFERNIEAYRSPAYNETQLRREFIDPFFEALGWDVTNKAGYAEQYKDVIHEDAIKVAGATKAPDYCFRIGGVRKFFLETKKPSIDIKVQISPAYQLRRYAWSAKLPLSILTDFEELAIYDCRFRPKPSDKPSVGRVRLYTYTQYINSFEEIYNLLSKESVLKGSFDKFAVSDRQKRGTTEVDAEFLKEIESWREALAKDIAVKNLKLSIQELNFAVQLTIDRIIFLRMCEDRGIEKYGQIQNLLNGTNTYRRLREIFYHADDKYNSGLFDFRTDRLTPELKIDDNPLKDIFKNLYYPESPYEFSVLGADILGHVYEQFLGKVIRLTEGHRAKVEEKPEVRKAGGVYYTPTYVVDYIVKNTVGKLCESKTPKQIASLRILDPACGSGSFLLGAYQYLLDYHRDWYLTHHSKKGNVAQGFSPAQKEIYQGHGGQWYLTTQEKKRILLDNIYGVDIDLQAVEVTKLSLLLKVLEGENQDTLERQMKLFKERALPDLGSNIKCGNSLIGPDFYSVGAGLALPLFDKEEMYRINPFDWEKEFPEIMKQGGFDAVIGNPPWGSLFTDEQKKYLFSHYINRRGEAESHLFFIERGVKLLNNSGLLGFITPNTWLSVLHSSEIRGYLLNNATFYEICELSKYIFREAPDIVPILVFIGQKNSHKIKCIVKRTKEIKIHSGNFSEAFSINQVAQDIWKKTTSSTINLRATPSVLNIIGKCNLTKSVTLSKICDVLYGIKTGNNEKYLSITQSSTHRVRALKTGELVRYHIKWKGIFLWWCHELAGYRATSIEVLKIIVQYIRKLSLPRRIVAALDQGGHFYPLNNYSYITLKNTAYSIKYLLGILNSALLNFYFANTFIDYNIKPTYLQKLPIRVINFSDPADKARHDKMVMLVEQMLSLHKQLALK